MPSHYKKKMPDRYKKTANQTRAYCCSHIMITFINLYSLQYFVLHIVLTCIRQESANEWYCNTMKYLPLLNAISQKDEKPCTAGLEDTTIHCVHIYQTGFNVIEFFFSGLLFVQTSSCPEDGQQNHMLLLSRSRDTTK